MIEKILFPVDFSTSCVAMAAYVKRAGQRSPVTLSPATTGSRFMVFFWAFGPEIEDAMNPLRYSVFYLLGGLVAALAQVAAGPQSTVPSLGASGAIAAVMGAFLVTYPRNRIRSLLIIFIFIRVTFIPAALLIGVWFLIQLFSFGAVANVQTGGVAYMAHIGGMIFGAALARLFVDPRRITQQQWS